MFAEQVTWAAEAGVDYVIAETFWSGEESVLAAETVAKAACPARPAS